MPVGSGLEVVSATIASVGANLTIGNGAGVGTTATLADRNGDNLNDIADLPLDDVTNVPDGVSNAADEITMTIVSTPRLRTRHVARRRSVKQGQLGFTRRQVLRRSRPQASIEVVAPRFALTKTPDSHNVDAGDVILYTVELTNLSVPFAAPGFDIVLNDLILDPNLSLVPGSVTVTSPGNSTIVSGNGAGDTQVSVATDRLGIGEVLIVTYRAVVGDVVPSGTTLVNRVDGVGDTFPGTAVGERPTSGSAGATVQVAGLTGFKQIVSTSLTETGKDQFLPNLDDLAIGERITYRLEARFAEGTSNLVVVDNLPTVGGAMELLSFQIVDVGGNLSAPSAPVATQVDTDGDGRPDQLTIDFGTIFNAPDGIIDRNDTAAILVEAIVVDDLRNQAGNVLVNTAQAFVNGALAGTGTASAEVVEPDLIIDKATSAATGDAGDEITFTVNVAPSPTMTGPAYDIAMTDLLAPGMTLVAGSVTTTGGVIVQGNGPSDTSVQLVGLVFRPDDPAVTVTYRVRLTEAVENGQTIVNTADLAYQSAPDVEARPYSNEASSQVLGLLQPDLQKSVALTDIAATGTAAFDPAITDVNQGETIVYRITARLGEGTQAVTLTDVMPAGLTFLEVGSISIGANISGAVVGGGVPISIVGNTLTFDFGTLVNQGDNISDAADEITINVFARAAASNAAGTQLQNDSTLSVTSPSLPAIPPVTRQDSDIVEVVAPDPIITKTANIVSGDAGDEVLYTVTVSQSAQATGPLLRVSISDLLESPGLELISGSVTTSRGTITLGNVSGDDALTINLAGGLLPGDAPIVVTYRARLTDVVEPGQLLVNTGHLIGATTNVQNPDTVTFDETAQATVAVDMPVTIDKTLTASSIPQTETSQFDPINPDVAIAEVATYRLTAVLSEGTQNVVITDTLPVGVEFVTFRPLAVGPAPVSVTVSGSPLTGQTLAIDFGPVVNPGNNIDEPFNLGVDVDLRILDVPTNVAGTVLPDTAVVTASSPSAPNVPGGTQTDDNSAALDVVEPELVLVKTTNAGFIAPGEAVPWTLTLSHAAGSTSAAFDIVIDDVLAGTGLVLVPGTVAVSRGTVTSGNSPGDNAVGYSLDVLLLGETATITFETRLAAATPPASTVVNSASGDFDSAPLVDGRPGTIDADASLPVAPDIEKAVFSTSLPETGNAAFNPAFPDVAVGETVTYRITATLPQATISNFSISDLLPLGLAPVSASVVVGRIGADGLNSPAWRSGRGRGTDGGVQLRHHR